MQRTQSVRGSVLCDIDVCLHEICGVHLESISNLTKLKIILDSTSLSMLVDISRDVDLTRLEFHTHRLCYFLHCARYKMLEKIPVRRKRRGRDTR